MKTKQTKKQNHENNENEIKSKDTSDSFPMPLTKDKQPVYKLEGQFPKLETTIDELLSYVYEKRKIRVSKAAKHFKTKPEIIEEWGKILEDSGFIELHYPMFGKPLLQVPQPRKHRRAVHKKGKKATKSSTKNKKIAINLSIIITGIGIIYLLVNRTAVQTIQAGISTIFQNTLLMIILFAGTPAITFSFIVSRKHGKGKRFQKEKGRKATKNAKKKHKTYRKEQATNKKDVEKFLKSIEKQYSEGIISKQLYEKMKKNAKERMKQ